MTDQIENKLGEPRRRSRALLIPTSIFGLVYLIFFILSFIPARMFGGVFGPGGSPVSSTVPFEPFDLEQIYVKLLFLLFLVGYFAVWKNEGIGGAVFILWYVAVWGVELLIVAPIKPDDWGGMYRRGTTTFCSGHIVRRALVQGKRRRDGPPRALTNGYT